jgi:hypothetical protein
MWSENSGTRKLIYRPKGEEYGFELFAANFGDAWGEIKSEDHIFIYFSDFEYLIDSVKSVYPLTDPETNKIDEVFDVCGMNCIHSKAWDYLPCSKRILAGKENLFPKMCIFVEPTSITYHISHMYHIRAITGRIIGSRFRNYGTWRVRNAGPCLYG